MHLKSACTTQYLEFLSEWRSGQVVGWLDCVIIFSELLEQGGGPFPKVSSLLDWCYPIATSIRVLKFASSVFMPFFRPFL